ncbi:MAG: zinc ABC transporter substrate-binding protein [Gammaproteobacteria bacterium]
MAQPHGICLSRLGPACRLPVLILVTVLLASSLATAAGIAAPAPKPIQMFVSVLPQKYFAERIGGARVHVSVMVGPGQSPATYDPTPRQLARLADAQLYWRMGVPFEAAWMKRIEAANPRMAVLDARDGIPLRAMEKAAQVFHESGGGAGGDHGHEGAKDPHIWLSPPLVKVMGAHLRDALIALDPADRARYEANYGAFAADLDRLDDQIRAALAPVRNRRFMDFHPSWGYFAHTYGLTQIPIEIEGKAPGPRTLAGIIDLARREGIRVIFVQAQFSRRDAQAVAQAIGGRVVAVDPLAPDYVHNLRSVAKVFREAMQ